MRVIHALIAWIGCYHLHSCLAAVARQAEEFSPLSNVPIGKTSLTFPVGCPKQGNVTRAMFTVIPTTDDEIGVSTYPANLLIAGSSKDDEDRLVLQWNESVAYLPEGQTNNGAGVVITFPMDQLKDLHISGSSSVQLLEGFTALETLKVTGGSQLTASLLNHTGVLQVTITSSATAQIETQAEIENLMVTTSGDLSLVAPTVTFLNANTMGTVQMQGNIKSGILASAAVVEVEGAVTGGLVTTAASIFQGGSVSPSGSIQAATGAKVKIDNSCDDVTVNTGALCKTTLTPYKVPFGNFNELPTITTGTTRCTTVSSNMIVEDPVVDKQTSKSTNAPTAVPASDISKSERSGISPLIVFFLVVLWIVAIAIFYWWRQSKLKENQSYERSHSYLAESLRSE